VHFFPPSPIFCLICFRARTPALLALNGGSKGEKNTHSTRRARRKKPIHKKAPEFSRAMVTQGRVWKLKGWPVKTRWQRVGAAYNAGRGNDGLFVSQFQATKRIPGEKFVLQVLGRGFLRIFFHELGA